MVKKAYPLFIGLILLTGCMSQKAPVQPELLHVQYSFSARPWLADLEDCAGDMILELEQRSVDTFDLTADLHLRIGDEDLDQPSYPVSMEELLVITNPQNPAGELSLEVVQGLFTGTVDNWQQAGGKNAPVQVWVFSPDEDIQKAFNTRVLNNRPVSTLALLAPTPEAMLSAIAEDVNSIGILTQSLLTEDISVAYRNGGVPVLVITTEEPGMEMESILACLQK